MGNFGEGHVTDAASNGAGRRDENRTIATHTGLNLTLFATAAAAGQIP